VRLREHQRVQSARSNSLTERWYSALARPEAPLGFAADHPNSASTDFKRKRGRAKRIASVISTAKERNYRRHPRRAQSRMEQGAGIYRTEASLKTTCDTIRKLKDRISKSGYKTKA